LKCKSDVAVISLGVSGLDKENLEIVQQSVKTLLSLFV